MSRDLDKISENIKKEEKKEDICNIPLSDYVKRLEPHVKQRYLEKISLVGIDPATLIDAKCACNLLFWSNKMWSPCKKFFKLLFNSSESLLSRVP